VACHADPRRLELSSVRALSSAIAHVPAMRALGSLTAAELSAIVTYVTGAPTAAAPPPAGSPPPVAGGGEGGSDDAGERGTSSRTAVSVYPRALRFGRQAAGLTSGAKAVTLANNGQAAVTLTAPAASGDFAVAATDCTTSLAAGAKCTVKVTFTPQSLARRSGALTLGAVSVPLSGDGASQSTPVVMTSTEQLIFPAGSAAGSTQTVTLGNNGPGNLDLSGLGISGPHGADFTVSSTTCGAQLSAGQRCTVAVSFAAQGAGLRSATLVADGNASGAPVEVPLSAQAAPETAAVPAADATATPSAGGGGAISPLNGPLGGLLSVVALLAASRRRDPAARLRRD